MAEKTQTLLELLENPRCFGVQKLPPHTASWPSRHMTIAGDKLLYDIDDWRLTLNGEWQFQWSPTLPDERELFYEKAFDVSCWDTVELPAHFELLGYGTPIYTNYTYPFSAEPPHVMATPPENWTSFVERNPTGRCRRTFRLPEEWQDRRIVLYFGAVSGAFRVWVNGAFAGDSEDSMSVAEFDVTNLIQPGENLIALEIYKYCSGSYLEDQDFWRLSGPFRDMFVYATAPTYIADCIVTSSVAVRTVSARLTIEHGGDTAEVELLVAGQTATAPVKGNRAEVSVTLPEIELWSAETPRLYLVTAILRQAGEICDIRHYRTGFRTVEVRDRQLFFNGTSIKLHGVNRHEHHPATGRVLDRAWMEQDIRLIKEAHFDAVRSSHYPNHPLWYELCDRAGLYVLDEANVESHGMSYHACVLPGDDPEWEPAVLDRIRRLVVMNRNHVSITLWSLGNEAGYGTAFEHAAALIRELDSRPIQYADMNAPVEFESQTYPTPAWLEEYVAGRAVRSGEQGQLAVARQHGGTPGCKPFIMNEYAHAMGNSTGNFREYWLTINRHAPLVGGFVWEFCEHALIQDTDEGGRFAYGGDFGDLPNDGNFCCDGLVRADRTPNPGYEEVRHIQQPLEVDGQVLRNRYAFTALTRIVWTRLVDGEARETGEFPGIAPGGTLTPQLPRCPERGEQLLRLQAYVGERIVATCEMPLDFDVIHSALPAANLLWREVAAEKPVSAWDEAIFATAPEAIFTRVATDNDRGCRFPERSSFWATEDGRRCGVIHGAEADAGRILLTLDFTPPAGAPEPARIGVRFQLARRIVEVRWYGRGPHESACDRKSSALIGRYRLPADDLTTDYTRPQENGLRWDTRMLELVDETGHTITICAPTLFGFTLRPYTSEALAQATHPGEIEYGEHQELILDYAQRGVGGDNSWGLDVHAPYRIKPEPCRCRFLIQKN